MFLVPVKYYGLNAADDDVLAIAASLQFSVAGYVTYDKSILDVPAEIQVCGENDRRKLEENDENVAQEEDGNDEDEKDAMEGENVKCPENGSYRTFDTDVTFPSPPNDFMGWAASGYTGDIVFYIYVGSSSDVVGQCSVGIQTLRSQSFSQEQDNGFLRTVPSGQRTAFIILLSLGSLFILWLLCCLRHPCYRRKVLPAKEPLLIDFEKDKQGKTDDTPRF